MSIKKTPNGTYRVRKHFTEEEAKLLSLKSRHYDQIFKTELEAKRAELELGERLAYIKDPNSKVNVQKLLKGETKFKDFYTETWLTRYKNGYKSRRLRTPVTIKNTEDLFRLHILPTFGAYTLNELNNNKKLVIDKMEEKAREYANSKQIRGYFNQVFDLAEEYDYIEYNRLSKPLKSIQSIKKNELEDAKKEEDLYLTQNELAEWINAVKDDYSNGNLSIKDFTLFFVNFFLSDRKSETYALQWKHINFEDKELTLDQALDKTGKVKGTKGRKKTVIKISKELCTYLKEWKKAQQEELKQINIKQDKNQFVFSYANRKGDVNCPVHIDYLNYKMNSVRRRHPNLAKCSPHKIRHTCATLAKKQGLSLQEISEGLTHTELTTTLTYINTHNVITMPLGQFAYKEMNKS